MFRAKKREICAPPADARETFTDWWDLSSLPNAPPGGRALIVPDFDTMATLQTNQGIVLNHSQDVDLVQGTVAWETLINSLAGGGTVQNAVNSANTAIAN